MQEANLEAFKNAIVGKVSENQLVEVWLKLLTQLIEDIERYQLIKQIEYKTISFYSEIILCCWKSNDKLLI